MDAPEAAREPVSQRGSGQDPPSTQDPPPGEPLPSLPKRVLDVFFSPGDLFARLKHDPRWFGALLVGAVLLVAATLAIPADMFADMMRQSMLESGQEMPSGFDPTTFAAIQKYVGAGFGAVSWFITAAILAGVTTLVFSFVLGDEGGYKRHLAVVSHALLIMAVGGLLLTPLKLVQGDIQASLNLGLFFPLEEGYAARFLRMLDLFWLWTFVVVGVGMNALDSRRSIGAAVMILLTIPIGLAAVIAAFTG